MLIEGGFINDVDDLLPLIEQFKVKAKTFDDVRHNLKDYFKPKLLAVTTNPALSVEERHKMFFGLTQDLASKDKGTLHELWYQRVYRPASSGQNKIDEAELAKRGVQLDKDRIPDLIDGNRAVEIKSTDGALASEDKKQFADMLKLLGEEGTLVPFKNGTEVLIQRVTLVLTSPSGAKANAKWVSEFFEDAKEIIADSVTFEVFNLKGERLVIDSDNYKKWAKNLQSWLEGKVKI
jgi:hypothetical protein